MLSNIIKEKNGIQYILLEDAQEFVAENKMYEIGNLYNEKQPNVAKRNRKGLFKITKDKNGKVGDFLYVIPSDEDLKGFKNV